MRCWGAIACLLSSVVGGEGRLKDQARLSRVLCSRLLLDISIAGLYHHPPCPMYSGPVRWQQLNPKRKYSAAADRYDRYKTAANFKDARSAGMNTMDRSFDDHHGYVELGCKLLHGELNSTVRGASVPVIDLSQGEGASSDGGSSPHEATPRSELLVSSDGSSYAAPSAGLVPDTRIACVSDNAIAFSSDGSSYAAPSAGLVLDTLPYSHLNLSSKRISHYLPA